jgi:DNA-binding response OmpR family regulator
MGGGKRLPSHIRTSARRGNPVQGSEGGVRLYLNPVQRAAIRDGESVTLTSREYIILAILIAEPGRIVPRIQLQQQLSAGAEGEIGSNTVEVHIHNLRRKLGQRLIRTSRGRGYWVDLTAGPD